MKRFLINFGLVVLAVVALAIWVKLPWIGALILAVLFALAGAFVAPDLVNRKKMVK